MIRTTIHTQRSIDNSWTLTSNHGVPSGLIVDLQITLPYTEDRLCLRSCRLDSTRKVFIAIYRGVEKIAWVVASESDINKPISLECIPGVSAHVLFGAFPSDAKEYITDPVEINPTLVHYYDETETTVDNTKLTVIVDGQTVSSQTLTNDITIRMISEELLCTAIDGAAVITANASTGHELLGATRETEVVATNPKVRTINHIQPSADGEITVYIRAEGLSGSVSNSCFTLRATDALNAKLAPEDLLDKHLLPSDGREYSYYPLDDVYVSGSTLSDVRNTFGILGSTYTFPCITAVSFAGGTMSATVKEQKLKTLELMYDTEV